MVGTLQALRSVSRPSGTVIQEALNLLSAMGGGSKAVKTSLMEMKAVQLNNEAVLLEAKDTITEADHRDEASTKRETGLQIRIKKAEVTLVARYEAVAKKEEDLTHQAVELTELARSRSEELDGLVKEIENRRMENETGLAIIRTELLAREEKVIELGKLAKQTEIEIEDRLRILVGSEEEIRERRVVVEALKTKLDQRDERLRAAMDVRDEGDSD